MDDELPRVSPSLLRDAATGCPRRLALAEQGHRKDFRSAARFEVANAIEEHARLAQLDERPPDRAAFRGDPALSPEEQALYDHATTWYLSLYGDRPARALDLGEHEWGRDRPDLGARLTSRRPLVFATAAGTELRVLRFAAPPPADLLDDTEVRIAVLRLAGVVEGDELTVYASDLVRGEHDVATVRFDEVTGELESWFVAAFRELRDAAAADRPRIGPDCGWCPYVAGCPAHAA